MKNFITYIILMLENQAIGTPPKNPQLQKPEDSRQRAWTKTTIYRSESRIHLFLYPPGKNRKIRQYPLLERIKA